jgi:hypothetical protein
VLATLACAPRLEDCRNLLPVMDGLVTVVQTPLGTPGCSCTTEEVVVLVEARRHYFSWERGQVWIDGMSVAPEEFSTKLDEAKAKHRAERFGAAVERDTRPMRKTVRDLGKTIKGFFK